jgi:hypothetical protein
MLPGSADCREIDLPICENRLFRFRANWKTSKTTLAESQSCRCELFVSQKLVALFANLLAPVERQSYAATKGSTAILAESFMVGRG